MSMTKEQQVKPKLSLFSVIVRMSINSKYVVARRAQKLLAFTSFKIK